MAVSDKLYSRIPGIDCEPAEVKLVFKGAGTFVDTEKDSFSNGSALIVADPVRLRFFVSFSPLAWSIAGKACAGTVQFVPV